VVVAHSEVCSDRLRKTTTTVRNYIRSHKHYTVMIGSRSIANVNASNSATSDRNYNLRDLAADHRQNTRSYVEPHPQITHSLTRHHRTLSCSLVEEWTATALQPPPRNLIVAGRVLRSCRAATSGMPFSTAEYTCSTSHDFNSTFYVAAWIVQSVKRLVIG
jgi:hypothetical protein